MLMTRRVVHLASVEDFGYRCEGPFLVMLEVGLQSVLLLQDVGYF